MGWALCHVTLVCIRCVCILHRGFIAEWVCSQKPLFMYSHLHWVQLSHHAIDGFLFISRLEYICKHIPQDGVFPLNSLFLCHPIYSIPFCCNSHSCHGQKGWDHIPPIHVSFPRVLGFTSLDIYLSDGVLHYIPPSPTGQVFSFGKMKDNRGKLTNVIPTSFLVWWRAMDGAQRTCHLWPLLVWPITLQAIRPPGPPNHPPISTSWWENLNQ